MERVADLKARLIARIEATGPISFADYMAAALYDPDHGYYTTRAAIGFEGDYITSSDLGPAFGRTLSRAVGEFWDALGRPMAWDLVEAGGGHGTFLRDLLASLERERPESVPGLRAAIVEVSPQLRRQQALALEGREVLWAASARSLAPIHGVVLANEVLDAFPVHVLVRSESGVREVHVAVRDGRLVETLLPASRDDLVPRVPGELPVGGRWEVSIAAEKWVADLGATVARGYVLFTDYGGDERSLLGREAGTLRGFAGHRFIADPLASPGTADLTASVNFSAIRAAAERAGMTLVGQGTQRDVLLALGIREPTARSADAREQLRAASRRSAADALLDPNGLGAFVVMCFAKDAPTDRVRMFARAPFVTTR
ncbi:MAG: class I SAM-dependent methyltransferase [Candidatus Limnocylindria bacterium]